MRLRLGAIESLTWIRVGLRLLIIRDIDMVGLCRIRL
jgi:hypothetical protein